MKPARRRLIWHIYPFYLLLAILSVATVAWYASRAMRKFHHRETEHHLNSAASLLGAELMMHRRTADGRGLDAPAVDGLCKALAAASGYRLTVILPSGKVIGDSERNPEEMDNHGDREEVMAALRGPTGMAERYSHTLRRSMMYVAVPVRADGAVLGVSRASLSLERVDEALYALWQSLAAMGLAIVVVAGIVSIFVSRRIAAPLAEIQQGAEALAQGDLRKKLPSSGIREIDILAQTMNQMADQLNERINAITRQRDEQDSLLACMMEGVIAVDSDKRVVKMNGAAARLLGVKGADQAGRSIIEVVRNLDLMAIMDKSLESAEPVEGGIHLADGDRHLQAHGTVLRSHDGARIGCLIVMNDITRLHKLETMRRDFVANVSHELKTPVTSIKGFVETLLDGAKDRPEDAQRFLEIISRQANRLQCIIEDLLELSRIEHGAEAGEIELQKASIRRVLENAVQTCQTLAERKHIEVKIDCDGALTGMVDTQLLERAVVNLLDNAVKYSESGTRVDVAGSVTAGEILIAVRDQGPGVPAKDMPRLFERFYRVDKGRSRELGGTGLGLAIVKQITLAHKGRVDVQSTLGQGSIFSIMLPPAQG